MTDSANITIAVKSISALLKDLLVSPLPGAYQTLRPVQFDPADFKCPFLSAEELTRLNRFKALKKQVEWMCGRYWVKTLVKQVLIQDRPLHDIRIEYMDQGAPFISGFEQHCLSLSHSGAYTAAALSATPGLVIGIDLERMETFPGPAFMKTAFTQREISAIGGSVHRVYQSWTLKEAYLKYIRKGFNENLHHVEIMGRDIYHCQKKQPLDSRTWQVGDRYLLSGVFPKDAVMSLSGPVQIFQGQ